MDAVFLRGHARTWNIIKDETIKFFNQHFNYPHWYIGIWDTTTISKSSLKEDFKNSNLIYVNSNINENELVDKFDKTLYSPHSFYKTYQSNYFKIGYLDYHLNIEKKNYELENNMIYENVHFIRPDIMYKANLNNPVDFFSKMKTMEVSGLDYNIMPDDGNFTEFSDFYLRSGSVATNIFCSKFFDVDFNYNKLMLIENNPHIKLASHCHRVKYTNHRNNLVGSYIIRPDYYDYINEKIETDLDVSSTFKYNIQWMNFTKQNNKTKMMEYINIHNIDKNDYSNWL